MPRQTSKFRLRPDLVAVEIKLEPEVLRALDMYARDDKDMRSELANAVIKEKVGVITDED